MVVMVVSMAEGRVDDAALAPLVANPYMMVHNADDSVEFKHLSTCLPLEREFSWRSSWTTSLMGDAMAMQMNMLI